MVDESKLLPVTNTFKLLKSYRLTSGDWDNIRTWKSKLQVEKTYFLGLKAEFNQQQYSQLPAKCRDWQ